MSTRREAREWALQLLFQLDFNPDSFDQVFKDFWADLSPDPDSRTFVEDVVRGVSGHGEEIDGLIRKYAENWSLERMNKVDRNVMRVALYEMLYRKDIPPVVSIDQAVEIAKHYGTANSGRFVNGILDRARKDLDRPSRTAQTE